MLNFKARTVTISDLLLQLFLMVLEKVISSGIQNLSDSFPLPPCSNSIYNHIRFPPSCIHTAAAASDSNI